MNKSTTLIHTEYPFDWPLPGEPIDLKLHDLPHSSSTTEWWYVNGHFKNKKGDDYSLFASFFRKLVAVDEETRIPEYAHSITWAIIDVRNQKYYDNSLVDKNAPKYGLERLRKDLLVKDRFMKKAAIEMLEKDVVPYPDRLFDGEVNVNMEQLDLKFDTNTFTKSEDGVYQVRCFDKEHQVSFELEFEPDKPVTLHGDDGVVYSVSEEIMFYYFIPRNLSKGKIFIKGEVIEVEGLMWYDHEFGKAELGPANESPKQNKGEKAAWYWISGQLDNGCDITAYHLYDVESQKIKENYLVFIDENGERYLTEDFVLEPYGNQWTSMRTFQEYPLKWKLKVPDLELELIAKANFADQEFATVISNPAFWEGRVEIIGEISGKKVQGPGFVEITGLSINETLEEFLKMVSRETIKSVDYILPEEPGPEKFSELISSKGNHRLSQNVPMNVYKEALIDPIRSIIDRGGKSWRSYAALACCDLVGGDPNHLRNWLALPEMMHVGSLIVDDVQDKSTVRRGGPACHQVYGEPIAINAGTACYFISQICMIGNSMISESDKLKIYEIYFDSLRAGHSGQALDIYGLDYLMEDVLEDNHGQKLVDSVLAIHRLKCAAPASYLARIGGIIGGGSEVQISAMAAFYDALGIAFQIIDDTLNLKGFKDDLKTKAEDISAGKITYPIAKAMHLLDKEERSRLWQILQEKTEDLSLIGEAIDLLKSVDVFTICEEEAHQIMDEGWQALDPHIRDSIVKLNLRAFSWYVLERHY